ncbi:MAG: methionyl-tRNA formyltransferase [Alphaproteobacteria bacterium]|nr:methionyl-tRNA formyltransferase [Alphaproteobacteria bacterium]
MRVVFMGTPDFSVPILDALCANHDVVAVYAQPPRAAGRGQKERASPVHSRAADLGLPVLTPKNFKKPATQKEFADHNADLAVVAAYGLILPQVILDAPRFGCVNVHASLLPRWRGAAPIQRAIMAGDAQTGITIMQMEAGLDTGPMLMNESRSIDESTTAGDLHDALSSMGAQLICRALIDIEAATIVPQPQPEDGVTYAEKIDKAEAALAFNASAPAVVRHINGLSPFPGGFIDLAGQRIKILRAECVDAPLEPGLEPGTVIDDRFTIACESGAVRPLRVQRAGKGPVDASSFLRGFELPPGTRLG